jgi:hypothetical protein
MICSSANETKCEDRTHADFSIGIVGELVEQVDCQHVRSTNLEKADSQGDCFADGRLSILH